MPKPAITRLPFDQYSRQKLASDIINALRKKDEKLTILDVGGYKGATHAFHAGDRVTVLDVFDVKEKDYIQGDATKMAFEDNSFDFVVSFDVFEHIPRAKRQAFTSECARVAKRGVVIAAPTGTPQNTKGEIFVNELFKRLHQKDHQWLKEHIDYRLPDFGQSAALLGATGLQVVVFPSNYLPYWLLMQATIFAASKTDKVGRHIDDLYEAYNTLTYPDGVPALEQNYRTITVGVKAAQDAKALQTFADHFATKQSHTFDKDVTVIQKVTAVLVGAINDLTNENAVMASRCNDHDAELEALRGTAKSQKKIIAAQQAHIQHIEQSHSYRLARKIAAAKNFPKKFLSKG